MSTLWLIKLILSHLLADFVLQPKKWVDDRCIRHFLSPWLYLHAFIAALLALIFIGFQYGYFGLAILISHTLIDGWKSYRPQTIVYFLIDQLMHLLVIAACWYYTFYTLTDIKEWLRLIENDSAFWLLTTAYIFLSFPAGIMIGQMTRKWSDQLPRSAGLANAGKWIGIVERVLILTFLLQDQYAAIGLLITAKGLLRFSEKDRQEEKTEYVLIGSLISFSIAVITGIIVKHIVV
ncbi:DUF3307 domain-containing protein [Agriterribacter sp.]|uniref:DUF3307 domain-containing protein n=1 Tax=Agriterribacter sp. TaxID=2821509 RepID=UPI002CD32997|nr:DUF3307 domain-containing protein [Agriterribacter sp.]HRO46390.1 DUF3307 domain-containing protein [Agriterribacter sp.]HRQ17578.1 DUF3307 domain-containing protein [Agriterribacter sp.]